MTGIGLYGSSRCLISSPDSLTSTAASVARDHEDTAVAKESEAGLTDQFFQFIKGRGADDGSSNG
jgi:hypothetical protein